jgi:hypothetical protein
MNLWLQTQSFYWKPVCLCNWNSLFRKQFRFLVVEDFRWLVSYPKYLGFELQLVLLDWDQPLGLLGVMSEIGFEFCSLYRGPALEPCLLFWGYGWSQCAISNDRMSSTPRYICGWQPDSFATASVLKTKVHWQLSNHFFVPVHVGLIRDW